MGQHTARSLGWSSWTAAREAAHEEGGHVYSGLQEDAPKEPSMSQGSLQVQEQEQEEGQEDGREHSVGSGGRASGSHGRDLWEANRLPPQLLPVCLQTWVCLAGLADLVSLARTLTCTTRACGGGGT